jgi:hypothetical protein
MSSGARLTPLPEDPFDPRLLALYRASTPGAKLDVVTRLNTTLIGLKVAQLAASRPGWSPDRRRLELRRWWLAARD